MLEKTTIDTLIERLETVRRRPGMFIGRISVDTVQAYLSGFGEACIGFGFGKLYSLDTLREVIEKRGWEFGSQGGLPSMRAKGLTEPLIADELIAIEIDVLKAIANRTESATG